MKVEKQSAIEYLTKKGYKTGYKEQYSITEKGLLEFMVDFAQTQVNANSLTQKNELVKADVISSKWLTLPDDVKNIMGRPSFACGKIAHRMRAMGFEVAEKAEEEQALVIWAMLEFYKEFGKNYSDKMNEFLKNG